MDILTFRHIWPYFIYFYQTYFNIFGKEIKLTILWLYNLILYKLHQTIFQCFPTLGSWFRLWSIQDQVIWDFFKYEKRRVQMQISVYSSTARILAKCKPAYSRFFFFFFPQLTCPNKGAERARNLSGPFTIFDAFVRPKTSPNWTVRDAICRILQLCSRVNASNAFPFWQSIFL